MRVICFFRPQDMCSIVFKMFMALLMTRQIFSFDNWLIYSVKFCLVLAGVKIIEKFLLLINKLDNRYKVYFNMDCLRSGFFIILAGLSVIPPSQTKEKFYNFQNYTLTSTSDYCGPIDQGKQDYLIDT